MKPCPHCAEPMQEAAVVCPHCGRGYHRTRTIRILVIAAVSLTTLAGGFCASVVQDVEQRLEERERAEFRQIVGPPPPSAEAAAVQRRQAIYRAAHLDGVDAAAKRYEKTVDEVRAIVDEGTRAGWPPPRR